MKLYNQNNAETTWKKLSKIIEIVCASSCGWQPVAIGISLQQIQCHHTAILLINWNDLVDVVRSPNEPMWKPIILSRDDGQSPSQHALSNNQSYKNRHRNQFLIAIPLVQQNRNEHFHVYENFLLLFEVSKKKKRKMCDQLKADSSLLHYYFRAKSPMLTM